ncbi:hypothetical protein A3A63_01315 [Candidatus Gottesmanbacteria bacterium RIFCSPLOWO2_01_FULL_46_9]|uniref:Uncharacterized protein n=1 Tax=Candidatus Gottesmanbacteria bacterium RIFCSPLOWO2_01_FULL_46_9 TaxID=1798394 RepID=A0A1F6B2Z6_9BACT|nr:MAG: hypothetical protein A3A63_01315 [Candidatus Gottesmanbacteria bacterium RIFCSPLOWO2_01_FULL_46_9]
MPEKCPYYAAALQGKLPPDSFCKATGRILPQGRLICPFPSKTDDVCNVENGAEGTIPLYVDKLIIPTEPPNTTE